MRKGCAWLSSSLWTCMHSEYNANIHKWYTCTQSMHDLRAPCTGATEKRATATRAAAASPRDTFILLSFALLMLEKWAYGVWLCALACVFLFMFCYTLYCGRYFTQTIFCQYWVRKVSYNSPQQFALVTTDQRVNNPPMGSHWKQIRLSYVTMTCECHTQISLSGPNKFRASISAMKSLCE